MVKQTAGRDILGDFAPKFAELNDLVTVVALMSKGILDSSFQSHLINAKKNGITKDEVAEILTHAAFYAGRPNAWAAFRMAKEVYKDE